MKRKIASPGLGFFMALGLGAFPGRAIAQCYYTQLSVGPNGKSEVQMSTGTCPGIFSATMTTHFSANKGAYATAVGYDTSNSFVWKWPSGTCSGLNGGVSPCLKYTGDCLSCPPDPAAQPGEISCWCQPTISSSTVGSAGVGAAVKTWMKLYVDADADGNSETLRQDNEYMRGYEIFAGAMRVEWEDLYTPPNGDYNDYTLMVEAMECTLDGWSLQIGHPDATPVATQCVDRCGDNPCSVPVDDSEMRFGAGVQFDKRGADVNRENTGRKLTLTLVGYYRLATQRTIAVCPVLRLAWRRGRVTTETHDVTTLVRYGAASCSAGSGTNYPQCHTSTLDTDALSIAFSRGQTVSPLCSQPSAGIGDSFTTPAPASCSPGTFVHAYEMDLASIDGVLTDTTLEIGGLEFNDLWPLVEAVEVTVFELNGTGPFFCPSGVNTNYDSVDPSVASSHVYRIEPPWLVWVQERK